MRLRIELLEDRTALSLLAAPLAVTTGISVANVVRTVDQPVQSAGQLVSLPVATQPLASIRQDSPVAIQPLLSIGQDTPVGRLVDPGTLTIIGAQPAQMIDHPLAAVQGTMDQPAVGLSRAPVQLRDAAQEALPRALSTTPEVLRADAPGTSQATATPLDTSDQDGPQTPVATTPPGASTTTRPTSSEVTNGRILQTLQGTFADQRDQGTLLSSPAPAGALEPRLGLPPEINFYPPPKPDPNLRARFVTLPRGSEAQLIRPADQLIPQESGELSPQEEEMVLPLGQAVPEAQIQPQAVSDASAETMAAEALVVAPTFAIALQEVWKRTSPYYRWLLALLAGLGTLGYWKLFARGKKKPVDPAFR